MLSQTIISAAILGLAASQNLVKDPSFEQAGSACIALGACTGPVETLFPWITNPNYLENTWTSTASVVAVVPASSTQAASNGAYSMDLNAEEPYSLYQRVDGFVPRLTYKFSFDVKINAECGDGIKTGYARVDGNNLEAGISFNVGEEPTWISKSFSFVATDFQHSIYLGSTSNGGCGPMIDNVVVEESNDAIELPVTTNLIMNGDFESALLSCKDINFCTSSAQIISPWAAVNNENVEIFNSVEGIRANQGQFSIDLNNDKPITIYQDVSLKPGQKYSLTFFFSKNHACDGNDKWGYVNILDTQTDITSKQGSYSEFLGTGSWQQKTVDFTAFSASSRIAFGSLEEGACGAAIDTVTLAESEWTTSGFARRRRRSIAKRNH